MILKVDREDLKVGKWV